MISVHDARKSYGTICALDGVDVSAPAGSVTAVVGPNGAGKSTLFRSILGLERLDSGSALVDGAPFARASAPLSAVGAAIDPTAFHPRRRAIDELRIAAASQGISRRRATDLLDFVGLADARNRRVCELSLGMRQRLALAFALMGRPRSLVLDEPLNGLDVDGIRWMRHVLREAADAGCAVLVSSHVLPEVERVGDRVYVLSRGRMLAGADGKLPGDRARHVVVVSDDPEAVSACVAAPGVQLHREGRAVLIRGRELRDVALVLFRSRIFVESLHESADSLETDYLRLIAESESSGVAAGVRHSTVTRS